MAGAAGKGGGERAGVYDMKSTGAKLKAENKKVKNAKRKKGKGKKRGNK